MSSLVRASALMGAGTIASRILGFVKAIVLAQALGVVASAGADSFAVANQLPNNLYAIVAGGVIGATLVPAIARSAAHHDRGSAYISKLMTVVLTGLVASTLIATLLAPVLIRIYASHWSDNQLALATAFAYWCLPQIFFYGLYTLVSEVLHGRSIFGPPTWAPIANNVISITGLGIFIALFGADSAGVRNVTDWSPGMVALLGGTATAGIAAQAVILFVFWRKVGIRFRFDFNWRGVGLRETGKIAGWTIGMILATQVAGLIETNVSAIASGEDASVFAFQTAWLGFMLPHSIIAVSLATAYFTRIAQHAADQNLHGVHSDTSDAIRRIGVLILWASAGMIAISVPFSRLFTNSFPDATILAIILVVLLIGLPAFSSIHVLLRVFFALGDGRTPFLITLGHAIVVSGIVIGCAFLPPSLIVIAVCLTLSVVGTGQALAAAYLVRKRLGVSINRAVVRALATGVVAALVAIGAGLGMTALLGGFVDGGFAVSGMLPAIVSMVAIGLVVTAVFIANLRLVRSTELTEAVAVLRRARRRNQAE